MPELGLASPLLTPTLDQNGDCPLCAIRPDGLCSREECQRAVLPQLARNIGWLKLMGDPMVEQKQRQKPDPKEKAQVERIGRRNARKAARNRSGGAFGFIKAITNRKAG